MNASASFWWPSRVYWEDTDGGGVVYYANYLRFLERARTEWLRGRGWSQQALALDPGILFTVTNVNINYKSPARLDDQLLIGCAPEPEGRIRLAFDQQIRRGASDGDVLVEARVVVACVDAKTFRPKRLPGFVLEGLA